MIRVVGIGAGGHAKVVMDILRFQTGCEITAFLDRNPHLWGKEVMGVPVMGNDDLLSRLYAEGSRHAFVGVGAVSNTRPRRRLYEQASALGFDFVTAIHPRATVAATVTIGAGVTIMAGAVVNPDARLGVNVIVNSGAIVEHDCLVGDHAHIATGAKLASTVAIGEGAHVGIGAAIRQCVRIGRNAVVGAGAVVVHDVDDGVVVVGVPARVIRRAAR